MNTQNALSALNNIIRKSRIHLYKPIQIAEILHRARVNGDVDVNDIQNYRNRSKVWRDQISQRLVGRVSTSSQKFQDNLFEANAIPPEVLSKLHEMNKKDGSVEKHIYLQMTARLNDVTFASNYISTAKRFRLKEFLDIFKRRPGLTRSVDKAYEIVAYSLFSALIAELNVQTTVSIRNPNRALMADFNDFIKKVIGLDGTDMILPARVYRSGVTNAADRGLDMWANFGPAIQVKHIDLSEDLADNVADSITSDQIVLICLDAERAVIQNVLAKTSTGHRFRAIITMNDLDHWYELCLTKYSGTLGKKMLEYLKREFNAEFPSNTSMMAFMKERGYA